MDSKESIIDQEIEFLRDQYRFFEIIEKSQESPCRVASVSIKGTKYTKENDLRYFIEPIFKAKTLNGAVSASQAVAASMQKLESFRSVEIELDTPKEQSSQITEIDVRLKVNEAPRFWAKTGTEIGNYEGNMNISGCVRHFGGPGSSLQASASYGLESAISESDDSIPSVSRIAKPHNTGTNFQLMWTKPLLQPRKYIGSKFLQLSAFKNKHYYQTQASHDLDSLGLAATVVSPTRLGRFYGQNQFKAQVLWRNLTNVPATASWEMQQETGDYLKLALGHQISRDTRDDSMLPLRGSLFSLNNEISTLRHDFSRALASSEQSLCLKSELQVSKTCQLPLLPYSCITASFNAGGLVPINEALPSREAAELAESDLKKHATPWSDRFQIGGPLSVRGFQVNGIGARSARLVKCGDKDDDSKSLALKGMKTDPLAGYDQLGNDLFWTAGLSLLMPLIPYYIDKPIKSHFWANCGQGILWPKSTSEWRNCAGTLFSYPSASLGAGIVARFSIVRVEVNYCLPIKAMRTDQLKPGLQFGVGLQFL